MALANAQLIVGNQAASDSAVNRAIDFLEFAIGPLPEDMRPERAETTIPPIPITDMETQPIELPSDTNVEGGGGN